MLKFWGVVTFSGNSKYRCLFSSVPAGVTSALSTGLRGQGRDKDPRPLRKWVARGPLPRALVGFLCFDTYGKNIDPCASSPRTFGDVEMSSRGQDMVHAVDLRID